MKTIAEHIQHVKKRFLLTEQEGEVNLPMYVLHDTVTRGAVPLLLIALITIVCFGKIIITHQTRMTINTKETLFMERNHLDDQWRNLILEEKAQAEHSRVEQLAREELRMQRSDPSKEIAINKK